MFKKKEFWIQLLVFVLALAVRAAYLYDSSTNPSFNAPILDSQTYDRLAESLLRTGKFQPDFFWQQFFYPFFLSIVYFFAGSSIICAKIVQLILSSITCLLVYRLGKNIFGLAAGICAGCIAAVYGPSIFFDCELLDNVWSSFWAILLIMLLLKVIVNKNLILCLIIGICGALSVITRPNFVLFFFGAYIWLMIVWLRNKTEIKKLALTSYALLVGFILITIPLACLSYKVTNNFGFLPTTGGINLYMGNNPDFEAVSIRPGYKWEKLVSLPARNGIYQADEAYNFFYDKTFEYIRSQPANFIKGLFHKTLQLVSTREIPGNIDIYLFHKWSNMLGILIWKIDGFGFPFGLLLPLSLLGMIFYWRKIPAPLYLFIFLYPLAIILTHVEARYRTPMVGPMCILAGAALVKIAQTIYVKQYLKIALIILIGSATAFTCSIAGPFYSEQTKNINYEAELYFGVGSYYNKCGQTSEAIQEYSKAIEIKNDYPEAHHNLGLLLAKQGQIQQALEHYNIAIKINPDDPELLHNLGDALFRTGKTEDAIKCFVKAIEIAPRRTQTMINLANAYLQIGQPSEALAYYLKVIEIEPENTKANNNLGNYYASQRQPEKAIKYYETVLKIEPQNARTISNLANVLLSMKKYPDAAEKYKDALQIDPNNATMHYNFGVCLEQSGKIDEAVTEYSKALIIKPDYKPASKALNRLIK